MLLRVPPDEMSPFGHAERASLPDLGTSKPAALKEWEDLWQPERKPQAVSIFKAGRRCLHLWPQPPAQCLPRWIWVFRMNDWTQSSSRFTWSDWSHWPVNESSMHIPFYKGKILSAQEVWDGRKQSHLELGVRQWVSSRIFIIYLFKTLILFY